LQAAILHGVTGFGDSVGTVRFAEIS